MYAHEPEIKIENCYLDILKIIAFSVVNTYITHNTTLGQNSCLCSIYIIWLQRSTLLICTRLTRHSKTDLILQKIFQTNSMIKIHTQEEKVVFFHDVHDHVIWVLKKDNVYPVCWLFSIWPVSLSFILHPPFPASCPGGSSQMFSSPKTLCPLASGCLGPMGGIDRRLENGGKKWFYALTLLWCLKDLNILRPQSLSGSPSYLSISWLLQTSVR